MNGFALPKGFPFEPRMDQWFGAAPCPKKPVENMSLVTARRNYGNLIKREAF